MGVEDATFIQAVADFLAVMLGVFFVGVFIAGYILGPKIVPPLKINDTDVDDDDLFAIATGNEEYLAAHCTVKPLPKKKKKKKKKKAIDEKPSPAPKPKVDTSAYDKLYEDCVATLVGLGYKKAEAKKETLRFLQSNPNTKTVEDFITGVFQR